MHTCQRQGNIGDTRTRNQSSQGLYGTSIPDDVCVLLYRCEGGEGFACRFCNDLIVAGNQSKNSWARSSQG